MAEDESDQESERLVEELVAIADEDVGNGDLCRVNSREYCRRFCEVVEDYTSRCQVPLPQLQVLQTALCCFTSATISFPAECEHVQYVLSRLALSLFELLLFFGKDEFYEAPLKDILGSVQECHDHLIRYDNTDLKLVTYVIKDGGPWENPVLQAILKGRSEPQDIVDRYLRSESEFFFELRVRYLIACERIPEAVALITTCLSNSDVSKNLYYHQAYFICLHMTRLTDQLLHEHVLRINARDGVEIICSTELEGKTVLALQLSEAFLLTQLQTGEMDCIWDLIFIWSKLQLKMNSSKQAFVEQCYQMLRIATNIKVIFPFIKTILNEVGEVAGQLAVELCGCALQLDLHDNPETKSLIYKTIAYLLPTDLEICRVCALSVFFLERTAESYAAVERLYKCSDEDYNEFLSCVENRVRFELLPILKRGLMFDPEFWNFSMIEEKCTSLLGEDEPPASCNASTLDTENSDTSNMDLKNGVIDNGESRSTRSKISLVKKSIPPMLGSYKIDHNVPVHQCTLCNKVILGGHIFRHAQAHQKKGCFSCVLCSRKFRNRVKILKHLKNHIKKMQVQPMAALDAASVGLTDSASSGDKETSCLENGNSSSSTTDVLTVAPAVNMTYPESIHPIIPVENHSADHINQPDVNDSEDAVDVTSSANDASDCIKINGSVCPLAAKQAVKEQGVYKCPAQGCIRLFTKMRSLNKHARIAHPADARVQQHLMKHNKGKCRFCQRRFADSKHFFDHMKRHIYPEVYFCQHLDCSKRFKLVTHLAEHLLSHESFQAQCSFVNCFEIFDKLSSLYEHEAVHYSQNPCEAATPYPDVEIMAGVAASSASVGNAHLDQVPSDGCTKDHILAENSSLGELHDLMDNYKHFSRLSKGKKPEDNTEVADLPVPVWKARKDTVEPKTYTQTEKKVNGDIQNVNRNSQESSNLQEIEQPQPPEQGNLAQSDIADGSSLNKCNVQEQTVVQTPCLLDTAPPNTETVAKEGLVMDDMQDVFEEKGAAGFACSKRPPGSPLTTYGRAPKAPFIRPQPPSYLDEQYISMPKRRKNAEELTHENDKVSKKSSERFRCGKCLTNYSSSEALNEHTAQNKCQLYFGFDSDDETFFTPLFGVGAD
uniref:Zinc finger protein 654 n=1 Tax=Xenopus tropicalis TaxID=8364 RepID=F6QKR3_XENTR